MHSARQAAISPSMDIGYLRKTCTNSDNQKQTKQEIKPCMSIVWEHVGTAKEAFQMTTLGGKTSAPAATGKHGFVATAFFMMLSVIMPVVKCRQSGSLIRKSPIFVIFSGRLPVLPKAVSLKMPLKMPRHHGKRPRRSSNKNNR